MDGSEIVFQVAVNSAPSNRGEIFDTAVYQQFSDAKSSIYHKATNTKMPSSNLPTTNETKKFMMFSGTGGGHQN